MSRIYPDATMYDTIYSLTEGNPDSVRAVCSAISAAQIVDPQNILGQVGPLLVLDECHIYGEEIWVLYHDICHDRVGEFIAVLRAVQLGILGRGQLDSALNDLRRGEPHGLDVPEIITKVRARLNQFDETRPLKPHTLQRHERETRRTIKQEDRT